MVECRTIMPPSNNGVYQGAFLADRITTSEIESFQQMSGENLDIGVIFEAFSTGLYFPTREAERLANRGGALFIKLEPFNPATWDSEHRRGENPFPLRGIANGDFDYLLRRFARGAAIFGRPVFVSFGHEMNGDWYPWGDTAGNTPQDYIDAYRHVHQIMAEEGACNLTWVWTPNIDRPLAPYYPGSAYANWVAVDGYNWSGTESMEATFADELTYLRTLGQPIMIGEFGCGRDNASCLDNFVNFVANPDNGIRAFVYFNINKEEPWAISTADEQRTYNTAVARHSQVFSGPIEFSAATTMETTIPEIERRPISSAPDLSIGRIRPDGRPLLRGREVEERASLEQMGGILEAIADVDENTILRPDLAWQTLDEFHEYRPDMGRILSLDEQNSTQFYWYFLDSRTYWENTISLLPIYVQTCLETNQHEQLVDALEMTQRFRSRIENQQEAENRSPNNYIASPSSYHLAIINLTEAEIRSQAQNQDLASYEEGVLLALRSLESLYNLQFSEAQASRPDYFNIIKGLTVLADLYQQLANLTREERYFDIAYQLYQSITGFDSNDPGTSLHLNIGQLLNDPLMLNSPHVDLSVFGNEEFEIFIDQRAIEEGLTFNLAQGHILEEDLPLTRIGINHYLRGVALIKEANLFASWPGIKRPDEILNQLENIQLGVSEIRLAAEEAETDDERNEFLYTLARLTQGDLLMSLADRINFNQSESRETREIWTRLQGISDDFLDLEYTDNTYDLAQNMIALARDNFYVETNPEFQYLYAWQLVKQLEISIRTADYVYLPIPRNIITSTNKSLFDRGDTSWHEFFRDPIGLRDRRGIQCLYFRANARDSISAASFLTDKQRLGLLNLIDEPPQRFSSLSDAATQLEICRQAENEGILLQLSRSSNVPQYLEMEFNYLYVVLLLNGELEQNSDGYWARSSAQFPYHRLTDPMLALELIEDLEENITYLPPVLRRYYEINLSLKLATVYIQMSQRDGILPETSADNLATAQRILNEVESAIAPALPPHLWYKLTEVLPDILDGTSNDRRDIEPTLRLLNTFIENNIRANYPDQYESIRNTFNEMHEHIQQRNMPAAQTDHNTLVRQLSAINQRSRDFANTHTEILAWDINSVYAELYHTQGLVSMLRRDESREMRYEYVQSALMSCNASTSPYDQEYRPDYIKNLQVRFDTSVPAIREIDQMMRERERTNNHGM